jgi:hypothetical protein
MAVAVTVDIPGGTEQQYEQVIATVFPEGKLPDGWLVHLAGPTENGWQARRPSHVRSLRRAAGLRRDRVAPWARAARFRIVLNAGA